MKKRHREAAIVARIVHSAVEPYIYGSSSHTRTQAHTEGISARSRGTWITLHIHYAEGITESCKCMEWKHRPSTLIRRQRCIITVLYPYVVQHYISASPLIYQASHQYMESSA